MKALIEHKRSYQQSPGYRARSPSVSQQLKQVIYKLHTGLPYRHYVAYCLVSKESSQGIFISDTLLAIDSYARQLRYYTTIPKLPLNHIKQLPIPKECIKLNPQVEFVLQKMMIGQVLIKWENERRQKCSWKLYMGNNKIRQEFYDIFTAVMKNEVEQTAQNKVIGQQYKISKDVLVTSRIKDNWQSRQAQQMLSLNDSIKNHAGTSVHQAPLPNSARKQQSMIANNQSTAKLNISLTQDNRRMKQQAQRYFDSKFRVLQIQQPAKEDNSLQKSNSMIVEWITAKDASRKCEIYSRFANKCMKKIEHIMDNFLASHLMHEEYTYLNVIKDHQIQIYYLPLIDSTQEDDLDPIFHKIQQEQSMVQQWQCLNYICCFNSVIKNITILTPMICLITFKSFIFYCKSSIDLYPYKQRINSYQYNTEINLIEKAVHMKLFNSKQQIYLLKNTKQMIFYFNRLSCVPKVSPSLPITPKYIDLFIKEGVFINKKDIDAISQHISNKLIKKVKEKMNNSIFATSCELMDFLIDEGLSQHYLPFLLVNQPSHTYTYCQRLIASQIISCALEWEVRRRMQIQLLKRREFGFAINQLQIVLSLLIKEDIYFMRVLQRIIKSMFNFTFVSILPLINIIELQSTISSLLNRLCFDCKTPFLTEKNLDWVWSQNYVNDYIELTPYIDCKMLNFQLFCDNYDVIKNQLMGEMRHEVNLSTKLQKVLQALKIGKDASSAYSISHEYAILTNNLKINTNYYFSHFISPNSTINSLQTQIYIDHSFNNYYTHSLQYLTTLNKVRWLARVKQFEKVEQLLNKQIEKAIIWNQLHYLINIYSFYSKFQFKQGSINKGLEYSLKALQYTLLHYDRDPTVLAELLIAEHAFQAANAHYNIHNYSKALELYQTVEGVIFRVKSQSSKMNLNEQFLQLYINKCSIHLLFAQYNQCLKHCLVGLSSCERFKHANQQNNTSQYQFKIYQILFRCYQIKNMRTELFELSNICSKRYLEQPLSRKQNVNLSILSQLIKMVWISVIKQVQLANSNSSLSGDNYQSSLKVIYLKKVKKELNALRVELNQTSRYTKQEGFSYLSRRILKNPQNKYEFKLLKQITSCLAFVSLNSRMAQPIRLYDKDSIDKQWLMLQVLTIFGGFNFMIGCIDDYLHLYDYQY